MNKKRIWVFINGQQNEIKAMLCAELLTKEAKALSVELLFDLKQNGGNYNPTENSPQKGDIIVAVADVDLPKGFTPDYCFELDDILNNPKQALSKILDKASAGASSSSSSSSSAAAAKPQELPTKNKFIVAVTSCPTGVAHTFMAAEGLEEAAKQLKIKIKVETQGSVGAGNALTADEIKKADIVIIAADREVELSRFVGKRVYITNTKKAITDGQNLITTALKDAKIQKNVSLEKEQEKPSTQPGFYKHLMNGVSFMIPFVVAGGLCIALAFALGGIDAKGELAQILSTIGGKGGFALMVPVLSGYIAYSIADRPGLAPGMIGGVICNILGAGFLGGIVSGFLAGYLTFYLNRFIVLPKNLAGLKPVLILPLVCTLAVGLLLFYIIGQPVANINTDLTEWLKSLQGVESLTLGLIIGGMMAVDMGGPVNKAAYAFSVGMLESQVYMPMAAAMAAGMTPPLAAYISTKLFKKRFTSEEREAGNASLVLGLAFITEGAIPFAARDPFRVIPSFIIGSALAGALSMSWGIKLMAPHGGIFVLMIPNAVSNISLYALAIVLGAFVSAIIMGLLKREIK